MKITKKKLLEIIKEEVSDVSLKDDKGMDLVLAGLLSSDKKKSLAALTRLTMVDKKVQYLDQEVKKLKKQQTGDINIASGRASPVKEELGAKTPMKISKKYLQEVIKEELQKIVAEKNGYGAAMFQQMIDDSPEAQAVKAKLENLDGVTRVYIDGVEDSKDPGFKLISVMLKVPAIQPIQR